MQKLDNRLISQVLALVCLSLPAVHLSAADPNQLKVTTKTDRPWREIVENLQNRFGWRISFEDIPADGGGGPKFVAQTPSGITITGRRANPVTIDLTSLDPSVDPSTPLGQRRVMDMVLTAHNSSGNNGVFRAFAKGDFLHIVPISFRDEAGAEHEWKPLLDEQITLARGQYNVGTILAEGLHQISEKRGVQIVQGNIPVFLAQSMVTEEADQEPFRDVLMRVLEEINGPRMAVGAPRVRLSWRMLYHQPSRQFFFNVVFAPDGAAEANEPQQQPSKPGFVSPPPAH